MESICLDDMSHTPTTTEKAEGATAEDRAQFTRGPWLTFGRSITADDSMLPGYTVTLATVHDPNDNVKHPASEREANARLIAAAPDLLEALKGALEYFEGPPFIALHGDMPAKLTRVTIAKAEGRAS